MKTMGLLDLERHFAFYGAYHSNPANILIHTLFVWPIFFTSLVLFYFTPSLFSLPPELLAAIGVPCRLNFGFFFALLYAAFYVSLDRKAGSLAALLCFLCWLGSCSLGHRLGFSLAWKIFSYRYVENCKTERPHILLHIFKVVLAAQLLCWTGQFIGHGVFERRAPALLDNLSQAFLMAPFFVLLELLQRLWGYEPYKGFHASVKEKIDADIEKWQTKKEK